MEYFICQRVGSLTSCSGTLCFLLPMPSFTQPVTTSLLKQMIALGSAGIRHTGQVSQLGLQSNFRPWLLVNKINKCSDAVCVLHVNDSYFTESVRRKNKMQDLFHTCNNQVKGTVIEKPKNLLILKAKFSSAPV